MKKSTVSPAEASKKPSGTEKERTTAPAKKRKDDEKLLPAGTREFRFIAQNIRVTNDHEKQPKDLYVRFVVGAKTRVQ